MRRKPPRRDLQPIQLPQAPPRTYKVCPQILRQPHTGPSEQRPIKCGKARKVNPNALTHHQDGRKNTIANKWQCHIPRGRRAPKGHTLLAAGWASTEEKHLACLPSTRGRAAPACTHLKTCVRRWRWAPLNVTDLRIKRPSMHGQHTEVCLCDWKLYRARANEYGRHTVTPWLNRRQSWAKKAGRWRVCCRNPCV